MAVLVKYSRCPTFPNIVLNTINIATRQESTAVKATSSLTKNTVIKFIPDLNSTRVLNFSERL